MPGADVAGAPWASTVLPMTPPTEPTEPTYLTVTRAAYDAVAVAYADVVRTSLAASPMDRAMLGVFAEHVLVAGGGRVGDLGCGPGRLTAYLDERGLDVFGVDLAPGMVAVAREAHPDLRFEVGSLGDLDLADGSLAGVVAWYSLIHTPPERQPRIFAELARVLAPGGHLLLAFQVGEDERVHREEAYGHPVPLDSYRMSPDRVTEQLDRVGITVVARTVRAAEWAYESTPQAYLLARRG